MNQSGSKSKESQAEKFKRLAREVGADEDAAVFEGKLRHVAKANMKNQRKSAKYRGSKKTDKGGR